MMQRKKGPRPYWAALGLGLAVGCASEPAEDVATVQGGFAGQGSAPAGQGGMLAGAAGKPAGHAGQGGSGAGAGGSGGEGAGAAGSEAGASGSAGATAGSGGQGGVSGGGSAGASGAQGCVDIRISPDLLPDAEKWIKGAFLVFGDRDHFWRDSQGVHALWKPRSKEEEFGPVYLSSFDPKTGAHLGSYAPPELGGLGVPVATGLAPDETVAIGSGILVEGKGRSAVALLRTDGTMPPKIVELQPPTAGVTLGIGWDGEAFAVHLYPYSSGQGLLFTRISTEGEILSPLQPFDSPPGFWDDIRIATNPVSGVSLAVNTLNFTLTTVAGHDRLGKPLPDSDYPNKPLIELKFPEELAGKFPSGSYSVSASAKGEGFLVAWSRGEYEYTTAVQALGPDLRASEDVVLVPAQTPYEGYPNLAVQATEEGFWLVGKSLNLRRLERKGGALEVATMIETKANTLDQFDLRVFTAREWEGERWVGFLDLSAPKAPLRILKVSPGCSYPWLQNK